ncbi:unnamed protein product [Gulo gulo]|uniref:Uncharacterized protein n=1 Tax=Gulo gulo TaxID=48420 RepID=A0A9X9PXJ9_GULGU|nr:unnamed protein product [Gulo gulo]
MLLNVYSDRFLGSRREFLASKMTVEQIPCGEPRGRNRVRKNPNLLL